MEKEVFVKIIDAIVEFTRISEGLNNVLDEQVDFGMSQVDKIVEALEIQFDDEVEYIYWWLFRSGDTKEIRIPRPYPPFRKNIEDMWEVNEPTEEYKIELPTAGDLYDWLNWNMANS